MKLFTIQDTKSERFSNPTAAPSVQSFTRDIAMTLRNPPSQPSAFHEHPGDFKLYCVGDFDESTGIIETFRVAEYLGTAAEFMPSPVASAA